MRARQNCWHCWVCSIGYGDCVPLYRRCNTNVGQGGAPRPHRPPPSAFGARLSDILMFKAAILIDMHRRSPRLGAYPPPHGTLKLPAFDLERPDNSLYGKYEFDVEAGSRRTGLRPLRQPATASA